MPETTQLMFKHQEVVTALLKQHGIHEGIWQLSVTFGFSATTLAQGPEEGDTMMPAAVIPVLQIGVQRTERLSNLSVDASKVNPKALTN